MTKEEILKRHFSENFLNDESDEGGAWIATNVYKAMEEYAQQIVLDKLPGDEEKEKEMKCFRNIQTTSSDWYVEGFMYGCKFMSIKTTQRITTREEVEKPYKDFLRGLKSMQLPLYVHNQINLLLKSSTSEK